MHNRYLGTIVQACMHTDLQTDFSTCTGRYQPVQIVGRGFLQLYAVFIIVSTSSCVAGKRRCALFVKTIPGTRAVIPGYCW